MAEVLDEEGDENEAQGYACVRERGRTCGRDVEERGKGEKKG